MWAESSDEQALWAWDLRIYMGRELRHALHLA